MTATTADDLRTNLIGAWALQSYERSNINGSNVTHPLGVDDGDGTLLAGPAPGPGHGGAEFGECGSRVLPMPA
jgi:hypothetical protein